MGSWIGTCLLAAMAQGAFGQATDTLKKIRETGVIVIGYRVGSIPFSYLDATLIIPSAVLSGAAAVPASSTRQIADLVTT